MFSLPGARPSADPQQPRDSGLAAPCWFVRLCWLLAAVALAHAVYVLIRWLNDPLLDQHEFRQTQTALSAYWLMHGGPFFAYETPVLGSPWSVPLEMPIYQLLVAIVGRWGVGLDAAGRLVSFGFFLGGLGTLRWLWRDLRLPPVGLPIAIALLCASPQYAFWSRTFMMESCAWALGIGWLALFVRFLVSGSTVAAVAAIVVGLLAVWVKATTLPPFLLLGGLLLLPSLWRWLRDGLALRHLPAIGLACAAMLVPLAGGFAWVAYSDVVKSANALALPLTSANLTWWNYGTFDQRISAKLWLSILPDRMLPDMFGGAWQVALVLLAAAACSRRAAIAALLLVVGYLTPLMIFTNLQMVHNYYQYANAAFLIVAVAVALASLSAQARFPALAAVALVAVMASQIVHFRNEQVGWMSVDPKLNDAYEIALMARAQLPADGSLVVLGNDWSSGVPYYARRKALLLPPWAPAAVFQQALADPQSHLAGKPFSGVVSCGSMVEYTAPQRQLIEAFLADRAVLAQSGSCRLLAAQR